MHGKPIPPPPTRFGAGSAVQAKPSPMKVPPPPTRFPGPPALQPKSIGRAVAPPPVRFSTPHDAKTKPVGSLMPPPPPGPATVRPAALQPKLPTPPPIQGPMRVIQRMKLDDDDSFDKGYEGDDDKKPKKTNVESKITKKRKMDNKRDAKKKIKETVSKLFKEKIKTDLSEKLPGRNDSGYVIGIEEERVKRSFHGEKNERLLRNLSTFLWNAINKQLGKEDAEVEAMYLNDRIFVSSNETGTMKSLYSNITSDTEKSMLDMYTEVQDKKDVRLVRTLDRFGTLMKGNKALPNQTGFLRNIVANKSKDEVLHVAISKLKGLDDSDMLESKKCEKKLILISGAKMHAEQKLGLALITSKLDKKTPVIIRGKKRPCFGCSLVLRFIKEGMGYSGLSYNERPGRVWMNSTETLKTFLEHAEQMVGGDIAEKWLETYKNLFKDKNQKTYVSKTLDGKKIDPGFDTGSDSEFREN